ncbi:hypothetical protein BH09BAC5_BH09BAC5_14480 [soil metagenome]
MITIFSGTNRKYSKTLIVAQTYKQILEDLGVEAQVFSMEELPENFSKTYLSDPKEDDFNELIEKYIRSTNKFIAVIPEYQGTFPGIFKLLLDGIPPAEFAGKKIAMVGVSSGRAGNLRGMDHLTSSFHYLKMHVFNNTLPISRIRELLSPDFKLTDVGTISALRKQAEGFLNY